ncbi:UDP-glucose/GDP-mannose dehydrogenase family protein [Candidatus Peregrinibacteria bacterium]|nr:UDP-glucose/GDP-mannose dehydrogenase family protein [Candidatus Peregrinibacteria bacterium]
MKKYTIAVVGLWHLGEIFSAGLADLGHTVIGIDSDKKIVANFQKGIPPLAERGLADLIKKNTDKKRLSFSAKLEELKNCDIVWLAFDTPVTKHDEVDLKPIWDFFKLAIPLFKQNSLIAISSQIPVGSCQKIQKFINEKRPKLAFDLAYVPENLQLGQAVKSFFEPKKIVVGAAKKTVIKKIEEIFAPLHTVILPMKIASAELSKHALNSFLATSLSFIYDIADVAKAYGADIVEVTRALRSDERIGQKAYLDASIGFSGGTLARDLRILLKKADEVQIDLPVISGVFKKNKVRRDLAVKYLTEHLGSLQGKKIAVFGFTYKSGTATLRRALALEIIPKLLTAGAIVRVHDPMADPEEVKKALSVKFFANPYNCAKDCHAVMIITNWLEFKKLNLKKLKLCLKSPFLFFDTRNFFYDQEKSIRRVGFTYIGIGH